MDIEQPNLIPDTHDPNPMPEAETLSETVGMQADQQDERLQAALRSMTSAPQDYSLTPMFQTTGTETGLSAPKPAINTVSLPPDSAQVVQRFMEDQQAMLAYSTQHALERTPDEAVKQNKIAKETGMGLDMVVRNYTDLRKEWRARQIAQADLFKTSPVLAEHMMRPEFSGVAVDDVEQLSGIEKAIAAVGNWAWNDKSWFWERWSRRSEGGTVAYTESEYGAQQMGGKPNLLEQWFEPETGQGVAFDENVKATMDVMYNDMLKRMSPEQARQEADRAGAILMTKHKFDARIAELRNGAEGELLSSFADLLGYEWQGGKQSQEAITAGLVAGAGAGAFAAAPTGEIAAPVTVPGLAIAGAAGAYAVTGAERSIRQTAGMMYLDMLDHGVAPDLARDYAMKGVWVAGPIYMLTHGVAQNMVSGAATRYASKKATNELADAAIQKALVEPTVRSAVVAVGKNAALPATAGFLGGATQSLIMSAARDGALQASGMPRMMDSSEGRAKILQEAVDMGVFMAIGAGMTNVLVPGERNPILETFRQRERFLKSEQQERFFQAVHDKARESKLADRDPEALGEFTDQAAREAGIDGMYISKAGLVQVMREMNLSMDKVDQLLPGASEQLKDPTSGDVVVGGYIKVKSGDVLGKLAKTEFGGRLMRHVTSDESIPTPAERAEALRIGSEMIADFNETPQQMMEKATELIERDNAKRESAQRIADNHAKALIDAGRPEDVAHADAAVMAGFAVALADKMGMTPEQAAKLFPINVGREGEPVVPEIERPAQFDQSGLRRTDTPAFRDYFGNSKVVDEQGQPIVVYHSTSVVINERGETQRMASWPAGKTFTEFNEFKPYSHFGTADAANSRFRNTRVTSGQTRAYADPGSRTYPVYLSIQNPLRVSDSVASSEEEALIQIIHFPERFPGVSEKIARREGAYAAIEQAGYDGLVYKNEVEDVGNDSWVIFRPEQAKSVNNRGTWSRESSKMLEQTHALVQRDAEYTKAVESGDTETQQRLVDEAAKRAGYRFEVWHGTNAEPFDVFDAEKGGAQTGAESAQLGFFATDNPKVAQQYANNMGMGGMFGLALGYGKESETRNRALETPEGKALLETRNADEKEYKNAVEAKRNAVREQVAQDPMINALRGTKHENLIEELINQVTARTLQETDWQNDSSIVNAQTVFEESNAALNQFILDKIVEDMPNRRVLHMYAKIENPAIYDAGGVSPAEFPLTPKIQEARDAGHDGVIFQNLVDPVEPSTHYVVFDSSQFKSADPITRNADGNLIPLSQRFNPESDSILEQTPAPIPNWARGQSDVEITPEMQKEAIANSPKASQAERNYVKIDAIFDKFPNPLASEETWRNWMATLVGDSEVLDVPLVALKYANDPNAVAEYLRTMRPDQLASRRAGFALGEKIRAQYESGEASARVTGRLLLWAILSRKAGAYPHESAYMDLINGGVDKWIDKAIAGKWTKKDGDKYVKWSSKYMESKKGGISPGAGVTSNANDYGRILLTKMSEKDSNGKSALQRLHDIIADNNTTTNEIRRAFFGLGDSVGIQNKVLSFALLVTGRWDTLVLDRVQFTHLWGSEYQKRAGYDNIYDNKEGGLAAAGEGHFGLAIYEALSRGMSDSVRQGYELAGLTGNGDGTLGAFHWDSWLIESSQAIGHPTIEALATVSPRPDLAVRQGKFDTFSYNFEYRADGQYQVPHLDGSGYRLLSPAEAAAFMDRLRDPKNNVVPKGFKVSEFDTIPWVEAEGVNRAKYDAILNEYGRSVDAADVAPAGSADARRPVPSGAGELEQSTAGGRGGAGDRGGTPEAGEVSPLAGAPRINGFTGPDPRIVAVAKQYAAANGINFRRQSEYATVDPLRAKRIAAAYEEMPHAPQDPRVKAAYAELIKQTRAQYDALYAAGYRFYFADENNKPYQDKPDGFDNPMNAVRDLRANQQMAVFPTDAGFGSGATEIDVSKNPLLADTGLMWHFGTPDGPLKPVSANDLFRAVHDAFGHSLEGAGFRARGEENAWQAHVRLFTGDAIGAMTSETRGQNSWLNYGPHGETNQTAKVGKTVFADQKTGLMPEWTWREGIVSDHTLEQAMPAPGGRRGAYDVARRLIKINKSSDATTVAHEVIHAITTTYQKLSMSSNAPEIIKDDFDKLLQWHGVAGATRQERFDNFHAMSFEQQKPFQEAVASSAEIYLSEGKAPTEALQPVFARFANWMRAIYGDIRTRLNDQHRAKFGKDLPMLTDDVRRVFDRMLATPDEIKRAEEARDMKAHFQTKEEALAGGLTEEDWAAYQQMQQEAHDAAVAELDANSLRVVQWARGARKREERALDKQLREERVKIREQVTEDLAKDKTYRAQSFIKYGTVSVESATGDTPPAPMLFANDATISEVSWAISREVEHDQAKISKSQYEQFRKVVESIDSTMTVEQLRAEAAKPEVPAKPADERLGLAAVPGTPKNFAAIKAVALIDKISKQYAERMERFGHKLNADAVKAMIGEEAAARLGYGKYGMLAPDGAPPDVMAEMFGFDSGEEMVRALVNAKPLKEEISNRVEERVHAEHSGLIDPKRRQEAIERAIHNEARARMIAVDLRHITKATQPAQVMLNAAKSAARDHINNKKIADIKVSEYSAAESRAARLARSTVTVNIDPEKSYKAAYSRAFADAKAVGAPDAVADVAGIGAGDIARKAAQDRLDAHNKQWGDKSPAEIARRAKQQQLFQNQLVVAATDVKDEIDTSIKDFRKFFAADDKLGKSRNIEMVSAARAILASFGLGKSDKTPADYIKQMQQFNPDLYAALEPIILRTQSGGGDYTQLTVNEFRAMRDAVEALWNDARRDQQVTIEGRQIAKQQVVTELVNRLKELGLPETVPGERQAPRMRDKWFRTANSVRSMVSRVEHWADATDGPGGNGPFTRYIFNPIKEALVRYRVDQAKYLKRYADLVKKLDLQSGKIAAPELNYTFGGGNGGNGKLELLGAMLHTGNDSNLRKLLLGRNWGEVTEDGEVVATRWNNFVQRMVNEGKLTKGDFDFLQSVWDLTEELKPLAQKAHRDMNGFYFKEVEATPVSTPWGDYRGGYVPAKVDPFIVQDAQVHAKMDALEGRFDAVMPSTGLGFTKARVEYNKPLALDLRLIGKHIDDVLRYSHVQPALKDVMRVLNSHEVKDVLSRRDPTAIQGMLIPWLNRAAKDSSTEVGRFAAVDKFWNTVRSRTSMNFMVANLRQLGHLGGFSAAYLKVEAGYINSALVQYMSSPHKTAEMIAEMSPEMADRMHNRVRDAKETLNDILLDRGPVGKTQAWVQQHGMFLSHCMHNQMDIVIWLGAFNQEMERMGAKVGDAEAQADAVRRADAAVRMTQGAGHAEDVSAYESGTPFYKTMTQFQGYLNTLMNLNAAEYTKAIRDMGIKKGAGRLVAAHILAFAIPMLAYEGLIKTLSGDWNKEEDDGWMHTILEYVFASYAHAFGGMVPFGSPALTFGSAAFHRLTGGAPSDKEHINVSPSLQSLESATLGTADTIHRMLSQDKEINGHNVRDTMTLMSLLTGIPLTPVAKPLSYEMEVRKGNVQPTSTADYIRGMASGTASPASKGK